jgi:hypothetical protein
MDIQQYDNNPNNDYNYQPEEDYNNYDNEDNQAAKKKIRGYRVIIILMTIILIGISIFCFNLYKKQQQSFNDLEYWSNMTIETMEAELTDVIDKYDAAEVQNDTLRNQISEERAKTLEMIEEIQQLKNERRLNYNALAKYKKEIESMRGVMRGYLKQIDSLNKNLKVVSDENIGLKKQVKNETLRADKAEEREKEKDNLVKQGSVLSARDICLVALNGRDNEISRIKKAEKLRVDFVVNGNVLAKAGYRDVYLCLTSPDGYPLVNRDEKNFIYQGSAKKYSETRNIDYQNEDTPVSIFYDSEGLIPGTYKIELYMDDTLIGSRSIDMK